MNWKITFLLALASMPGVIAMAWLTLPLLVDPGSVPVPLETLQIATAAQLMLLVTVAAAVGTLLGRKIGLAAPVLSAMADGGRVFEALRPRLLPGLAGGVAGAAVITAFHAFSPDVLAAVQGKASIPVVARVLYGGITEEVLIRWGLMTGLAWAGWRVFQAGDPGASGMVMWGAIGVSALLFGVAHVPSVANAVAAVSLYLVAYITIGNALFGLVAGYLFWRYGLEAAIIAHILAHVFAYAVIG